MMISILVINKLQANKMKKSKSIIQILYLIKIIHYKMIKVFLIQNNSQNYKKQEFIKMVRIMISRQKLTKNRI